MPVALPCWKAMPAWTRETPASAVRVPNARARRSFHHRALRPMLGLAVKGDNCAPLRMHSSQLASPWRYIDAVQAGRFAIGLCVLESYGHGPLAVDCWLSRSSQCFSVVKSESVVLFS